MTKRILYGGKSDDLARSHGFFVYVRDRLINESDPLFGLTPLVYGLFNRFRADIKADDLDAGLKASRETVEESTRKSAFRTLLREVFNEANSRYERKTADPSKKGKKEGDLAAVPARLVDYSVADAIAADQQQKLGAEADNSWFYLRRPTSDESVSVIQRFYNEKPKFRYNYATGDPSGRMVRFDPVSGVFALNENHEFVREYGSQAISRTLLEDLVTAEVLLEIYLRESHVPAWIVGDVLEKRDSLLRSLVKDHIYSPAMVAKALREASNSEYDLEVALVMAARVLGFVANHISGSGKPDGNARFTDYPGGSKTIILEAKSSGDTPSLGALDLAGVWEHMKDSDGCLLVAPSYPGETRGSGSAVSARANLFSEEIGKGISCWTVEQLASFVEQAEIRQLNARDALEIILFKYDPDDVTTALSELLDRQKRDNPALYVAVLTALRGLEKRLRDRSRTIDMIATEVTRDSQFENVPQSDIEQALRDLEKASQGGMNISSNGEIRIHLSLDELSRRLSVLTRSTGRPQTLSTFREFGDV